MVVTNYRILLSGLAPTIITISFMSSIKCYKIADDIDEVQQFCRVSGGVMLPIEQFPSYSCATCYRHIDERLFENGTKFQQAGMYLRNRTSGEIYEAAFDNTSSPIFKTFLTDKVKNLWIQCCQAAVKCCKNMRLTPPSSDEFFCPRTWDGWNCWPDTPNGTVAKAICPTYIYFHSDEPQCTHYATKTCWENSTWFRNHKGNEYSDYSTCGQSKDIRILLKTHLVTFIISILLLIPALVIFFSYRQLRVHRIFMHKNLFTSLLLSSLCVVIFESYFIMDSINNPDDSMVEANGAGCKIFYTITKYLRLSTYTWMFCEGYYLHKLIAAAFAEQKSYHVFYIIGWGVPVVPVLIWAIIRQTKADESCWIVPAEKYEWVLLAPMLVALVVNFCFLAHIIQVVVIKLRSTNIDEPTQFRRAVRATMVLIPLFGLHFLLISYHPTKGDCYILQVYNIATYSMDGLQGGIVSLIFCYFNNEVLFLLKRTYSRQKMVRDISSHMSSRKKSRESRTSVSTNAESIVNENGVVMIKK